MLLYHYINNRKTGKGQEPSFFDLSSSEQIFSMPLCTESILVSNATDINALITFINNMESMKHLVLDYSALKSLYSLVIAGCNPITYLQIGLSPLAAQRDYYYSSTKTQIVKCQIVDCPNLMYLFISNSVLSNCTSLQLSGLPSLRYLHIDSNNCTGTSSLSIASKNTHHFNIYRSALPWGYSHHVIFLFNKNIICVSKYGITPFYDEDLPALKSIAVGYVSNNREYYSTSNSTIQTLVMESYHLFVSIPRPPLSHSSQRIRFLYVYPFRLYIQYPPLPFHTQISPSWPKKPSKVSAFGLSSRVSWQVLSFSIHH